jgi:predicted DNA-binding protein
MVETINILSDSLGETEASLIQDTVNKSIKNITD